MAALLHNPATCGSLLPIALSVHYQEVVTEEAADLAEAATRAFRKTGWPLPPGHSLDIRASWYTHARVHIQSEIYYLLETRERFQVLSSDVWEYEIVDWPAGGRINPRPGQSGLARLDPLAACLSRCGGRINPLAA